MLTRHGNARQYDCAAPGPYPGGGLPGDCARPSGGALTAMELVLMSTSWTPYQLRLKSFSGGLMTQLEAAAAVPFSAGAPGST